MIDPHGPIVDIIRNPPLWVLAIIMAIVTAHALKKIIEVIAQRKLPPDTVIPILEFFIVVVLSYLAIHSYYEGALKDRTVDKWYDHPFVLVVALIVFGFGSICLFLVSNNRKNPDE